MQLINGQLNLYNGLNTSGSTTITGSVNITGSLTASLTNGYTWVGNANNVSTLVSTSSFGGSATIPAGTVSGSSQISIAGTSDYSSLFGGVASATSSLNQFTSSTGIRLTNLETTSASVNISVSSLNAFSASENTKASTLATYTGSIDTKFTAVAASTSSLNSFTSSATLRLTNLETTSASVNISVSSLNTYSASVSNSIQQLSSKTGSYATTGSNSFNGNTQVTGSLTVSGSVTITGGLGIGTVNTTVGTIQGGTGIIAGTYPGINGFLSLNGQSSYAGTEGIIKNVTNQPMFISDYHGVALYSNGSLMARFGSQNAGVATSYINQGNFLIGTSADNGYKLNIASPSVSGSLYVNGYTVHDGTISGSQPSNNPSSSLLLITGSILPNSGSTAGASAMYMNTVMSASANNQTLVGLDINPTFTTGSFTGVSNLGLRVGGFLNVDISNKSLNIINDGILSASRGIAVYQNNNGVQAAVMQFYKSRGTNASPTAVANGDVVGAFTFKPYISSAYAADRSLFGASMTSTTGISQYFIAGTTDGNYTPNLLVAENGNTTIGNLGSGTIITSLTLPTSKLQVAGNTAIGYTTATAAPSNGLTVSGNTLIGTSTDSGFRLDVSGSTRLNGNTQITGSLGVTGSINVSGSSSFTGSVNITGSLTATSFNGTINSTNGVVSGSSQILGGTGIISSSAQLSGTTITNLTVVNLTTVNETASVIFSSGSNTFGDAGNDIHSFTGSVQISGSQTITGSLGVFGNQSVNGNLSSTGKYVLGTDLSLIPITSNQSVITTWWGMQLVGNRQNTVDYTPTSIGANSDFSIIIPNQQASKIGLIIKGQTSQTGNLLEFRDINNNGWSAFNNSGSLSLGKTTSNGILDVLGNAIITGSLTISGSQIVTGSVTATSFTGSLFGTASYALNGSSNATLVQSSAASTWTFNHYLQTRYPIIQIYDNTDSVIIPQSITAVDTNTTTITFSSARTGTAVASKGGYVGSVVASATIASSSVSASVATTASYAISASAAATTFSIGASSTTYGSYINTIQGANTIISTPTGSYSGAFYKYVATSGSNARAGQVMAIWNNTTTQFNDVSTNDIGTTNDVTSSVALSAGSAVLSFTTNTPNWNIKTFVTYL
jgi:hypothetical protein